MAYLACDEDCFEFIFSEKPERDGSDWVTYYSGGIRLPSGSIAKLIGIELTWEDEPYELI